MKKYIRSSEISNDVVSKAIKFADDFRGSQVDLENHSIVIPFHPGATEEELMSEGMLGAWFVDNGFNISFGYGDCAYTTKPTWTNCRGWVRAKGHTAYLRNRLIATITW